ncbi:Exporter protein, RND family [hydrothermal vent metagenome]|uniref:Exporter protein, RND family n=1 Tax=hydrothermal vent metagenome TaxID=652676 RepID=A0A3B1BYS7_9ZZZZ
MSTAREKIGLWFEIQTRWIYKNRLKTLAVMSIFIAGFLVHLPQIKIDTSIEGFLHDSDPVLVAYNKFREQFGRDEMIVIAINPPDVFDIAFLRKLKKIHNDLENKVPHIDDITSLVNVRNVQGKKDELIVEDLLEDLPETKKEVAALKKLVLSKPLYKNLLISEDGKFTTVVIKTDAYSSIGVNEDAGERKFLTDAENNETIDAIRAVMARYNGPDFPLSMAGSPVMTNDLKLSMMSDMRHFMLMALFAIGVTLFLLFRRISGVVAPLFIVSLSLLSTVGLMAYFNTPIKLPTQILPSFLLAVGVGASVHALALFYQRLSISGDKEDSIVYALGHSGLPIAMTSLTTAVGLGSFAWAQLAPMADLGRFASAGVLLSLVYTIVLLPALIAVIPIKVKQTDKEKKRDVLMNRILTATANFSTGHPWKIIAASFIFIAVSLALATQVRLSHDPLSWFPDGAKIKEATKLLDKKLKGTVSVEVILDVKKENRLYEPKIMSMLDALPGLIEKEINNKELFIGKTIGLSDMLKEINQALHENRKEFYSIPQDRKLIAQEFLLFEMAGSDDLEDVVDSRFSKTRVTVKVPWLDSYIYGQFIVPLEASLKEAFKGVGDVWLTGLLPMFSRTLTAALNSSVKSYVIAFVVITFMMILLIGDLKIGLLSMIPNLAPIIVTVGIMGALDFPLDMFTMLIGSIAIGLAVDDTIHFMHNFMRYHHETGDAPEAVRRTLLTTGRAMLVTSIVLSAGFFIFMFASMSNLFNFGLLTGLTIIFALIADFLLAPAIMTIVTSPTAR